MSESPTTPQEQDGRADFDFFTGSWTLRNRVLRDWLKGSTAWEEFGGASAVRKILGGLGHVEEVTMERESGSVEELVVRLFDPYTRQWRVYEAEDGSGFAPQPVIATFKDGRMVGYAHQPWKSGHVFRRVVWSDITATSFHWEQAFSTDGGATWETNWIADFTRR